MTEPSKPRQIDPAFIEVDTPTHRFTTSVVRNDLVDPPFKTYSVQMTDRHPEFKGLCEALNRYSGQQLGGSGELFYPIERDVYRYEPLISAPPDLILIVRRPDSIFISVPETMFYNFNIRLYRVSPENICNDYIESIIIELLYLRPKLISMKEFFEKQGRKLLPGVQVFPATYPNTQPTKKEPLMQKKQDLDPIPQKITRLETVTGDTVPIDDVVRAIRRHCPFTLTVHGDEIGLDDPSKNIVAQAYPVDRSFGALYDQLALVVKHHSLKDKKTYLLNIPMTWYDKQENVPVMLQIQQSGYHPTICVALPDEYYLTKFKEKDLPTFGNDWMSVSLYFYLCQVAVALKEDTALELSPEGYMKGCVDVKLDLAKVLDNQPVEELSWDMEQPIITTGTLSFDRNETRRVIGLTRVKAITIVKDNSLYTSFAASITMLAVMDGVITEKCVPSTIKCRIPLLKSKFKDIPVDALVVLFADQPEPLIKVTLPIDAGTGKCMTGYDDFLSTEEKAEDYLNTVMLSLKSIIDKQELARMLTGSDGDRKTAEEVLSDYRHPGEQKSPKEELGGNNKETEQKEETTPMSLDVDGNDIVKRL